MLNGFNHYHYYQGLIITKGLIIVFNGVDLSWCLIITKGCFIYMVLQYQRWCWMELNGGKHHGPAPAMVFFSDDFWCRGSPSAHGTRQKEAERWPVRWKIWAKRMGNHWKIMVKIGESWEKSMGKMMISWDIDFKIMGKHWVKKRISTWYSEENDMIWWTCNVMGERWDSNGINNHTCDLVVEHGGDTIQYFWSSPTLTMPCAPCVGHWLISKFLISQWIGVSKMSWAVFHPWA